MALVEPTVLASDGRYCAAIRQDDGHYVRGEYKYLSYDEAQAEAEAWLKREQEAAAAREAAKES